MKLAVHSPATAALLLGALLFAPATMAAGRLTNSLGQVFTDLPDTNALVCVWETRVRDYRLFATETRRANAPRVFAMSGGNWRQGFSWDKPAFEQADDHPVTCVTWEDARAFCEWLTERERQNGRLRADQRYRLPTDAEWSRLYGATKYPGGDAWGAKALTGNFAGEEARNADWYPGYAVVTNHHDGFARTAPVGSFAASASGVFDLGGNVWEWCEDPYNKALQPGDILARDRFLRTDASPLRHKITRGGSWRDADPTETRGDYRRPIRPAESYSDVGFRCVLDSGATKPANAP